MIQSRGDSFSGSLGQVRLPAVPTKMKHDGPDVVRSFVARGLVLGLPLESEQLLEFSRQATKFTRRDFEPGHFTASAVVAQPRPGRVFLIEHPKLGRWLQPGGHIEAADRSIAGAAAREAREETGFHLDQADAIPVALFIHRIPAWKAEPSHLHLDLQFLFRLSPRAAQSKAELGGRWFALESEEAAGALEHTRTRVEMLLASGEASDQEDHSLSSSSFARSNEE